MVEANEDMYVYDYTVPYYVTFLEKYFSPVLCFLLFNVFAVVGNIISSFIQKVITFIAIDYSYQFFKK